MAEKLSLYSRIMKKIAPDDSIRQKFLYTIKRFFTAFSKKNRYDFKVYKSSHGLWRTWLHVIEILFGINIKNCKVASDPNGAVKVKVLENLDGKTEKDYEKFALPKVSKPLVSIVIPVYNQFNYTYLCLKSILQNTTDVEYEVIVANDNSSDLTTKLEKIVSNVKVVTNKKNLGFLLNCNNAAQYANGRYILFLNNDTQVQEKWLSALVSLIESDKTIGMVGSKLIYPDGTLQEAGGIIFQSREVWNYGRNMNPEMPEYNYVKEVDYISGASIMIRKDLWKEIGGFDTRYVPAYCEDSDLAFEVRKHGYKVMYQPKSVVIHFEGKSNGTDTSAGIKKYQIDNSEKLFSKWNKEIQKYHAVNSEDVFHARNRSTGKKTILVIDHYIPQVDKDAGSKTTWQYLQMFVKQGFNVIFLGDNFYKDENYVYLLENLGIEVLYGLWYSQNFFEWFAKNHKSIDFVYLNRPHISIKYVDFLRKFNNVKLIYYGHDLHFLRNQREYELTHNDALLPEIEKWKKIELELMRKVSVSYYPSIVEENFIHEIDEKINVKAITAYIYNDLSMNIKPVKERNGLLFVGGFGHTPNIDAVKWFINEIYPKVYEKLNVPFYIVGSNAPDEIKKLKGDGIVFKGFVTEQELSDLYSSSRITVVPLRYGAGVKGKVVEALAKGSPVITTSVGAEGLTDIDKVIQVCDEADDFADSIMTLYSDEKSLNSISISEQKYVKDNFSTNAVWKIIAKDFE